jgi:hypothetical protein
MRRRRSLAAVFVLVLLVGPAEFCLGSRAELDGRALPRFLAVDPTLLRLLPGSVSRLGSMVLADIARSGYDPITGEPVGGDDFALGLAGKGLRFGYFLDQDSHNLIVGGGGGWGITLGFTDTHVKRETREQRVSELYGDYESLTEIKQTRAEVRLGAGWQGITGGGRVHEIGVGGRYIDAEFERASTTVQDTLWESRRERWVSDPGVAIDITYRTVAPRSGLLARASFLYEDLNPSSSDSTSGLEEFLRAASIDLGLRIPAPPLADLVVGVSAAWRDEERSLEGSSYLTSVATRYEETSYMGAIFASAEMEVIENLRLRGGVVGRASFDRERTEYVRVRTSSTDVTERSTEEGRVQDPEFRLGLGWTWKSVVLDFRLSDTLNLDNPVIRWAAAVTF